jgi:hypothetical protein
MMDLKTVYNSYCGAYIMGIKFGKSGHSKIDDGKDEVHVEFNVKDMIKIQKRNIYEDYVLYEIKGRGASAEVYRSILKASKQERAVKVVRRNK